MDPLDYDQFTYGMASWKWEKLVNDKLTVLQGPVGPRGLVGSQGPKGAQVIKCMHTHTHTHIMEIVQCWEKLHLCVSSMLQKVAENVVCICGIHYFCYPIPKSKE